MTLSIQWTPSGKRGFKTTKKKGIADEALFIIRKLAEGQALSPKYKDHQLRGDMRKYRECHIRPDWLLVYQVNATHLVIADLGTHDDLFGKRGRDSRKSK